MLELGKGAMLYSSTVCPAADDTEKVKATEEMADPAAQTKEEAGSIEEIAGLAAQDIEDDFPVDPAWLKSIGFTSRLVEAADMLHRPREAFRPGTLGSSHFRSLEAQGSSSANHVGIPPKAVGRQGTHCSHGLTIRLSGSRRKEHAAKHITRRAL